MASQATLSPATLSPAALSQHNGESSNDDTGKDFFKNAGKTESMLSEVSVVSDGLENENYGCLTDMKRTENDLAGFSVVWAIGFFIVVILKLINHQDVKNAKWYWIILIPIVICCLTWIFSYVITKYRKKNFVESMKLPAFILPFICKITISAFLFIRLFYSSGGITDRFNKNINYSSWCDASMIVVWICLTLSVITTEIIITTVMVCFIHNNNIQHILDLYSQIYQNLGKLITKFTSTSTKKSGFFFIFNTSNNLGL